MTEGFKYSHTVQYYETDQMKIVHHSNYIRWFEECRVAWMKEISLDCDKLEELGIIIPVVDVSCQYKSMTRFGETVEVELFVSKFNGIVMDFTYKIFGKESGELKVTGTSSHCFIGPDYNVMSLKKKHRDVYDKLMELVKNYQYVNQ